MKQSKLLSRRSLALVVAIVLAAAATVTLASYVRGVEAEALAQGEPVEAFVAKDVIPAGMSAEQVLAAGLVERQPVPRRNVPAGAIGSLSDIEGRVAVASIAQGEEIVADRFVLPAQVGSRLDIPEGHHAMAVEVAVPPGVAGFVQPGDHIGIMASIETATPTADPAQPAPAGEASSRVQFLLQDVQVLAIGSRTAPAAPAVEGEEPAEAQVSSVLATLALTPADAEKVAFATLNGSLYFTLMPEDTESVDTPGRTSTNLFAR